MIKKLFALVAFFSTAVILFADSVVAPVVVAPAASGGLLSWIGANWMQLVVSILAIDAALIPLFPSVGLLKSIKSVLGGLVGPPKQ